MAVAAHTYTQVNFLRLSLFPVIILYSIACTELGAYQVAPKYGPSLILNVLQTDYT
jgi:hypothetical protein